MPDAGGMTAVSVHDATTDGRGGWIIACTAIAILSVSYGSPLLIVVGLKPITAGLGTIRELTSLAARSYLGRHRPRRHLDGLARRPDRHPRHRDLSAPS